MKETKIYFKFRFACFILYNSFYKRGTIEVFDRTLKCAMKEETLKTTAAYFNLWVSYSQQSAHFFFAPVS